ncbi:hypothetical protein PCI56_06660 [Plesiomonas shigelloides subsp. oncorhynchi]|nr:hypothetical protein [Plesiomonas shigelloides]
MTGYRSGSKWNDLNELRCLLAYKNLEELNFPRNMLSELAAEIAAQSGLTVGSVKAKIGNYKSVAGITGHSNASQNTLNMYKNHGHLNSTQLQKLIQSGTYS